MLHHYLELITSVISYFIHPQLKDQQRCQRSVFFNFRSGTAWMERYAKFSASLPSHLLSLATNSYSKTWRYQKTPFWLLIAWDGSNTSVRKSDQVPFRSQHGLGPSDVMPYHHIQCSSQFRPPSRWGSQEKVNVTSSNLCWIWRRPRVHHGASKNEPSAKGDRVFRLRLIQPICSSWQGPWMMRYCNYLKVMESIYCTASKKHARIIVWTRGWHLQFAC